MKPTAIIIFGATGDLAYKKLIPALFDLSCKSKMPEVWRVIGLSRKDFNDESFREFVKNNLKEKNNSHEVQKIEEFVKNLFFVNGDSQEAKTYEGLSKKIQQLDSDLGLCTNKLFYLAMPPDLYAGTVQNLANSGLTIPCAHIEEQGQKQDVWSRVLIEKPFGSDPESARKLDEKLSKFFTEDQIFRIDHYLAKETIQNILTFRFANSLFEPTWNRDYIEKIDIEVFETKSVDHRARFYDKLGALRDVGQNHLLQMLALITMEDPGTISTKNVRDARTKILKDISIHKNDQAVRAQYENYLEAEGVSKDSKTETYFQIALEVKNKRWKGVPITIRSGKALNESHVKITVTFKEKKYCVMCRLDGGQKYNNVVVFDVSPKENITVGFWVKRPGFENSLDPSKLSYSYDATSKLPDAYERVVYDCVRGNQTLFASTLETKYEWEITEKVSKILEKTTLKKYKIGSLPEDIK